MKPYIILLGLILIIHEVFAQDERILPAEIISKSTVIYTNVHVDPINYQIPLTSETELTYNRTANLVQPSFAIRTTRDNGWSRELEFNSLSLFRVENVQEITTRDTLNLTQIQLTDGFRKTSSSLGVRHEWMKLCHTSRSEKLRLYLGVGVNTGVYYVQIDPKISTEFKHSVFDFSLNSQIVPRMTYDFSSRIRLDVNLLANWITNNLFVIEVDNPRIPRRQNTASYYDLTLLSPQVHVRVGLAFDIWEVN